MQKMFSAGSTVYVHGKNARPRVIDCSITNSENVGIFIDNYAQVTVHHLYKLCTLCPEMMEQ